MRLSLPWFTVAFSVAYIVIFALDLALFFYYPLVKEFHFSEINGAAGPAMHWYGLLASAAIFGFIASLIARDRWIPRGLIRHLWIVPSLAVVASAFMLRHFFG